MGHRVDPNSRLFGGVRYNTKTTGELRDAMTSKVDEIERRIEARDIRIRKIREEYALDAERLAALVIRYQDAGRSVSYQQQGQGEGQAIIPAGVIANLVEEHEMIDNERTQVWKLRLVLRNLREEEPFHVPRTGEVKVRPCLHELTDHELDYLGF